MGLRGVEESEQILRGVIEAGLGHDAKNGYGTDGNMGNALA